MGRIPGGCSSKAFIGRAQWLTPVIPALWEAKGLTLLSRLECSDVIMDHCSPQLTGLRMKGFLAQTPPLEFPVHQYQPGDHVLIKSWKRESLNQLRRTSSGTLDE
uniref:Uncharacterized protein ZNF561-AS1 n=1 Tax=Homo sapiens TaxID=9606 RepID=CS082_HUMAN|nr:RecName: Full=Uncharacterized protein ZNF561-AS1; AltName: Full=ZNF561 antisense RNA 1; AltName: Full=ZNF561 antisense gene protein 1 [Homo sapiens]